MQYVRKRQLICVALQWPPHPWTHDRPHHPIPPSNAPIYRGRSARLKSSITTEGGQAAEATGAGAAPVQVAERLQADGTCGYSTTASQDTSMKNQAKGPLNKQQA